MNYYVQNCLKEESSKDIVECILQEPMRWVGMYIAAASAVCVLAMAADLFNGFRTKRFWFRCKYFTLNAFTLSLLAVAMKLPVDLTSAMFAASDWLAKLASLVFMLTALANFMPSLGSMTDQEILANVAALCFFLGTVAANICIQTFQMNKAKEDYLQVVQWLTFAAAMLVLILLTAFVSVAVMVLSAKRLVDTEYQELHKVALNEEKSSGDIDTDSFQRALKRYWVMAETGSPQFVIARSAVCTASCAISIFSAVGFCALIIVYAFYQIGSKKPFKTGSMYDWSTRWILGIQSIGVVVGNLGPIFRCLLSLRNQSFDIAYRISHERKSGFVFIEKFWIQRLEEWRDRTSFHIHIQHLTCRKYLHNIKRVALNLVIGVQILVVGACKLMVFISALPLSPFFYCFTCIKKLICHYMHLSSIDYSRDEKKLAEDFTSYVLLLDGEAKLPHGTLKRIFQQADSVIQRGKRNQLEYLLALLHKKSSDLNGVREFDSIQVPSLCSQEPPYFWALPLVTLASIAVALPNIPKHKPKQLVGSLSEGLPLVKLIDMATDTNREFSNIRRAADVAWAGFAIYSKWLRNDLKEMSRRCKDSRKVLQELSNNAEKVVVKFKEDAKELLAANPLHWPFEVLAANAMYRISRTILLAWTWSDDEALFEKLTVTIADVMAACLTNFERVIRNRCHQNAIEEREKNVHEALLLLGKTEKILQLLHQMKYPCVDPDKAVYVKEWRTSML